MNGGNKMKIHTNITIFGGTGDLTFRKLLPALYTMFLTKKLSKDSRIVIIGRRDYDSLSYRNLAEDWVKKFTRLPYTEQDFFAFAQLISYFRMDLSNQQDYLKLNEYFSQDEITSHIFYLAVAPKFFTVIADGLETVCGACHGKVIIEKPFGENLQAAEKLNQQLERHFGAEQIYRIDHYLGKEMVRNIQAIRFTNPIFTDVWNSRYIECVQISALEDVGVETRGGYYDASGALKDMVQNHLFQILSIVAMEQPEVFNSTQMHQEQLRVLRALRPLDEADVGSTLILGQYEGYRREPLVAPDSTTETFAALRLFIENERWKNTPFYIRTGKRTGVRQMEVSIVFKRSMPEVEPDILTIKIQPTEGVYIQFNIKRPGDTEEIIPTKMDFCQNCNIVHQLNTPEAYERLLTACINGERSWFSQWDQIEISWNYIEQLKQRFKEKKLPVYPYEQGSPGPKEAGEFLKATGHSWIE